MVNGLLSFASFLSLWLGLLADQNFEGIVTAYICVLCVVSALTSFSFQRLAKMYPRGITQKEALLICAGLGSVLAVHSGLAIWGALLVSHFKALSQVRGSAVYFWAARNELAVDGVTYLIICFGLNAAYLLYVSVLFVSIGVFDEMYKQTDRMHEEGF